MSDNCTECGCPLGGTEEKCYECGGEKSSPTRQERLKDAVWWKQELGVKWSLIQEAHKNE